MRAEDNTERTELFFTTLLQRAGINLNGTNPWDIQVHDERFFKRFLAGG